MARLREPKGKRHRNRGVVLVASGSGDRLAAKVQMQMLRAGLPTVPVMRPAGNTRGFAQDLDRAARSIRRMQGGGAAIGYLGLGGGADAVLQAGARARSGPDAVVSVGGTVRALPWSWPRTATLLVTPFAEESAPRCWDRWVIEHWARAGRVVTLDPRDFVRPELLGELANEWFGIHMTTSHRAVSPSFVPAMPSLREAPAALGTALVASAVLFGPRAATAEVTHFVESGSLRVSSDGSDDIRIFCEQGLVKVNGKDPGGQETACNSIVDIGVEGGPGANAIKIQHVAPEEFPDVSGVTVNGAGGDDTIFGSDFGDTILAASGNDSIGSNDGDDSIVSGTGDDTLLGNRGLDTLAGSSGNDTLSGGPGGRSLDGGAGFDVVEESFVALEGRGVTVHIDDEFIESDAKLNEGLSNIEAVSVAGSAGPDVLDAAGFSGKLSKLDGNSGDDSLIGGSARDSLIGGDGNDSLSSGAKEDTLTGGRGDDTLDGGMDTDRLSETVHVEEGPGLAVKAGPVMISGKGIDEIRNVEEAKFTGGSAADLVLAPVFPGSVTVDGNRGDDSIMGGFGNDSLSGNEGQDALFGGSGDDTLSGGEGNDTLVGATGDDVCNEGTEASCEDPFGTDPSVQKR